jgi:hypothetical protein
MSALRSTADIRQWYIMTYSGQWPTLCAPTDIAALYWSRRLFFVVLRKLLVA